MDDTITVPGATIADGQLVPSSIEATVTASQPGADYDISTTTRFRIPGFQSSAKYNGFYADSVGSITGGFIGVLPVPTPSDLAAATSAAQSNLDSVLYDELLLKLPSGVKVVASSSQITITSQDVSSVPNAQGQYSLTTYGTIKLFAFKETDLLSSLATEVANQSSTNLSLHDYSADYSAAQPNFAKGTMTVSLILTSDWVQPFDQSGFQARAEGLDDSALKTLIFSLPGAKSADISFWPFWVTSVPQNPSKIHVDVAYAP